ncbi:MAG: gliding motility-associated C-terminal domain-containing protein [Bacteroidota bacterium]
MIMVVWGGIGNGTITLKQTNLLGCDSTVSRTIIIQSSPEPVITGPPTACAYKTTSYSTNTTLGSTYQWSVAGGVMQGSATDTSITVKWNAAGIGTITLKQTNTFGCDSTVSRTITIQPTPAPIITGPSPVCEYKTTSYTTNTTVGNTYQWSVMGGAIQGSTTDSIVAITWNATGSGTITLKQTNTFGCDSTVSRTITIQPTPAPMITGLSPVCAYKTTSYTTNTTTGNTYQWSVTGGTIQGSTTDTMISVKWNAAGIGIITLKQTNTLGCDSTVSRTITIQPTPVPAITGPSIVCAYKQSTYIADFTAGDTYEWSATGGVIEGASNATMVDVKWNAAGSGTITLKQTNSLGCDSTVSRIITIRPTPVPIITGPSPVCEYKTTSYTTNTAAGNTYQWSVTGGTIQGSTTDTTITVVWGVMGSGTITLKQTNIFGCDSTVSRTIIIQPSPAPAITGPAAVCAYKASTYITNATLGNTYEWSVTGGMIQGSANDTSVLIRWNASGTGSVTLKQIVSQGCDSTVSRTITIQPTPAPIITGPSPVCEYKTTSYTTNTTAGNTYLWNVLGGTIQGSTTDTTITVVWGGTGIGTITLKQTNAFGCDSTVSRSITIRPTPAPIITGPSPVCEYKTTNYTTNTTAGNTYQWSVTGGTIQGSTTDSIVSIKWNATGVGTITLKQTNTFGCDSTVSRIITIQPTPAPIITGPSPVCEYKTTSYTTNTTAGNAYQWSVTGGTIQGSTTDTLVTIKWNATGIGTVTLTQTNSLSCDSTVSRTITIQPTPAPIITGPSPVCEFKTTSYTTNATAGNTYQWNVTGGTIQGSAIDTMITVVWGGIGSGTITLKQTNTFSCDSTVNRTIIIQSSPAPVITGPPTVCEYKTTTYTTNTTFGNTYEWSVTGGTIQGSSTDTSVNIRWNATGTGTITLKQIVSQGCDSIVNRTITIQPTPVPIITGPSPVCEFKQSTYTTNGIAGNTYQWSVTGGAIQGTNTDTIIIVKWSVTGPGTVSVKQTNILGCDSTTNLPINIQPTPVPVITGPSPVCEFKTSSFATNTTIGNTYQWSVTGGVIQGSITDTTISIRWGTTGSGSITLKQTNALGCDSTVTRTITIQPTPVPVITGPSMVCEFKQNIYTTNVTASNTYEWSVTGGVIEGLSNATSVSVKWNATGSGTITLKQTNTLGCDSAVNRIITIQPTPAPIITGPSPVCEYKTTNYTTNTTTGNMYQWSVTGGTIQGSSIDTMITVAWSAMGTGSISVKQTNTQGCDSTVSRTITIQPTPAPVIIGPPSVCAYKTSTYITNPTAGNSYQWNVTGGVIQGSTTDTTITVAWNAAGSGSITLKQTNSLNCDSTVSRTITIQPTPAPIITGPSPVCEYKTTNYTTNTTTGNTYQWSVTGGTIQGSTTDTMIAVVWSAMGTGSISLKQTNTQGCDSTVSRMVTIQPTPAPVIIGPSSVCAYKTTTYSTNTILGNSYQWSITGGVIQGSTTDTIITVAWNAAGIGIITLTQTNALNCDSTVSRTITIQATPAPVITGPPTVCEYKTTSYSTNTTAGNTYQWSVTGGDIQGSATASSITVKWNGTGSGLISLKQTNLLGCDSTESITITIQPTPTPIISGPVVVCEFSQSTYTTNAIAGASYLWSVSGGTIQGSATDTTVNIKWSINGSGVVTLKQTNMFGCDSTVNSSILIKALPIPFILGPSAVCAYKESIFMATPAIDVTYQWSVTGGVILGSSTGDVVSVRWNAPGAGAISLWEGSLLGCDSTVINAITIQPTPAPVISGPSTVCEYKQSVYTINGTSGNTYQWTLTGGTIIGNSNDTVVVVKWNVAGTGSISVKQTNSTGCDSTFNNSILIQPTPVPVIAGPAAMCEGKQATYSASSTLGNTYEWYVVNGIIQGSNTDTTVSIRWSTSGIGTIIHKQTNVLGCDSTVSRSINILATPVPVISGPAAVCAYKQAVYTTNVAPGMVYQWSVSGGTIQGSATDPIIAVRWNAADTGIVTLTHINIFECDSTVSLVIMIDSTPAPDITGPASVCEFKQSVYSTNTKAGNTYQWTVAGGVILGATTDTAITVQWSAGGAGTVSVKQTNLSGCDSTKVKDILIQPKPVPVIYGPGSVCSYKQAVYTTNVMPGNAYQWSVTGGVILGSATDTVITVKWDSASTGAITLMQINAPMCDSTISRSILIRQVPAPAINGPGIVCAHKLVTYTTNATVGNVCQWNVIGGTVIDNSIDTVITVRWNAAGIGIITVKQINTFGCDSSTGRGISIQPTPIPVISGPASICAYQQSTYTANITIGSTYQWNVTGGIIVSSASDSTVTVKWNASGTGTITLSEVNTFGCDSVVSRSITIKPLPVPVINGTDTICAFQYSIFSTPVIAGDSYKWAVIGGTMLGWDTSPEISVIWDAGFITRVSLKVTNNLGCDSTILRDVFVKNAPQPTLEGDTLVCSFGKYTYRANNITGAQYKWNITGGTIVDSTSDTAVQVMWGTSATCQVGLLVTSSSGCDSFTVKNISVVSRVQSAINGPDTVCERKVNVFSVTPVPGHTYLWSAPGGTIVGSATSPTLSVVWNTTGNKQLTLYERTAADCDTTLTHTLFVKPTPQPLILGAPTVCAYKRGVYAAAFVPNDTYTWSVSGGVIESTLADTQITIKWNGATAGSVFLKQTNKEGCDSTIELKVTVKQAPIPVIAGANIVCAYRVLRYATSFGTGNTYQWTVTGGTLFQLNDTLIDVKWGVEGAGNITLKVVSPSLCDSTTAMVVDIKPTPNPDFNGSPMVCAHSVASYGVLAQTGHTYQWTVAGGNITGSTTASSVTVLWGEGGVGMLTLKQQSPQGCDSTISRTIQIKTKPATVIQGPAVSCAGPGTYSYSALPVGGQYTYDWSVLSGSIVSGAGTRSIEVNWPQKGAFQISLKVTDTLTLCDSTITYNIIVDSVVRPIINATALAGCVPLQITFSGNDALPGYSYEWDFGNGNYSSNTNPEYVYTKPGTFKIRVRVTNGNGCKDSASSEVIVSYIPVADFNYEYQNERIYAGEDTVKFLNKSNGGNQYMWEITSEFTDTTINPKNIYDNPGFYNVTLVTIDTATGCENRITKRLEVRVRERLFVPNAFTPDGDGLNDFFHVSITNIVEFEVIIFDRWGSILYKSNDPYFKWDGTYQNEPVQADVYGFLITGKGYHGKVFSEQGTVTLLR